MLKEEKSIEVLKILGLIQNIYYFKNMVEENISQEFRLKIKMKQEIILLKK